ncbi:hypothetical protein B296_00009236 [Ensete ventricosum]|uniref:Uncharacterized protein n=1 Tax=Ensete ventricosum TaxID=4639 RepID=A0A426Z5C1_ENSVE|nr:hypothetical protein B296_00009236 [Ensete ventricosum]
MKKIPSEWAREIKERDGPAGAEGRGSRRLGNRRRVAMGGGGCAPALFGCRHFMALFGAAVGEDRDPHALHRLPQVDALSVDRQLWVANWAEPNAFTGGRSGSTTPGRI